MKRLASAFALVLLYVVLFLGGTALFPVPTPTPPDPADAGAALAGMLACAVIDTALLAAWAARTRLRGPARWAALAGMFYGVKTLTSQLEALWFMPNVSLPMAPALFGMMLPLALAFPVAVIAAFGSREPVDGDTWITPDRSRATIGWALLSVLVYPTLFWTAGYFVAFQSAAVREFYGGLQGSGFFGHLWGVFRQDPAVVPFEIFRGALWIVFVLPLLRTSRASVLSDALLTGATLALVQNDVHLLPNPLMAPEVRLYHFLETASSNFVWGVAIVAILRGWAGRLPTTTGLRALSPVR